MTSVSLPAVTRGLFEGYETAAFFDEMFLPSGEPRPHYAKLFQMLGIHAGRRNLKTAATWPTSRSCCRASPSRFTATAQAPSGYFPST